MVTAIKGLNHTEPKTPIFQSPKSLKSFDDGNSNGFLELGIPEDKIFMPADSLLTYFVGLALNEQSFPALRVKNIIENEHQRIVENYPHAAAGLLEMQRTDFSTRLEFGIQMHLAAALARSPP